MKSCTFLFSLAVVFLVLGCSEKSSMVQPEVGLSQAPAGGGLYEPAAELYSIPSADENIVITAENPAGATVAPPAQPTSWHPSIVNGKLNLVWWSNWENTTAVIDHQVAVGWTDDDGVEREAKVTPIRWDGVEPATGWKTPKNYDRPPRVYTFYSMAQHLAAMASVGPKGKIYTSKQFGENVQDWPAVYRKAEEELAVHLPAAVKWVTCDLDRATFEQLWGEDYWAPYSNWDEWWPHLVWAWEYEFGSK